MFKDAYRRENDKVRVRESLLDEIRYEQVKRSEEAREKKLRGKQWWIAIPTVAAAAAACFAVVVGIRAGSQSKSAAMDARAESGSPAYVAEAATESAEYEPVPVTRTDVQEPVGSYEALTEIMRTRSNGQMYYGAAADGVMVNEAAMPQEMPAAAASEPMTGADMTVKGEASLDMDEGTDYSGTNNQVSGVDEADIVKTDGTWIYSLSNTNSKAYILSADGKDTKVVSTIKLNDASGENVWCDYSEMILYGDRLYIIGTYYDWTKDWNGADQQFTFAEVYDLGDRTAPTRVSTLKQQGSYRTARLIDGMLVIVSDYRVYPYFINEIVADGCIPKIAVNGEAEPLVPGDIYVNPDSDENGFAVVTTLNAADGSQYDSHKAVLGGCNTVYCSGTDLLIASQEWTSDKSDEQTDANGKHFVKITSGTHTNLFRFTLNDGKVEAVASASVSGALLNQFSMDAYDGYFRLVVTRSESTETIWTDGIDTYEWSSFSDCALFVLDGDLNVVGSIENLAKDERVQSVRFMGDTAYFVTFRQTDPLFAADLSDPANPKVLSALKIPGFSAYLHPFGDGKLLGIGYDAEEEHGWTENVKLSMFDISDPANVTEAFKLSVKDANYTSVQYNHKAVFVDVKTGTVAFPADDMYLVFRADGSSFKEVGRIKVDDLYWFSEARGLYVGSAFYVIAQTEVVVLSFETMEKLASVKLK